MISVVLIGAAKELTSYRCPDLSFLPPLPSDEWPCLKGVPFVHIVYIAAGKQAEPLL